MKPLNLPADLIKEWARRQTLASAKLEGRELPADYMRPLGVQEFLDRREQREAEAVAASWVIYDAV
jgi:hypothetical protein